MNWHRKSGISISTLLDLLKDLTGVEKVIKLTLSLNLILFYQSRFGFSIRFFKLKARIRVPGKQYHLWLRFIYTRCQTVRNFMMILRIDLLAFMRYMRLCIKTFIGGYHLICFFSPCFWCHWHIFYDLPFYAIGDFMTLHFENETNSDVVTRLVLFNQCLVWISIRCLRRGEAFNFWP